MNNKPITVARQEFIEKIVADINESGLPFFVVVEVLNSMLPELQKQVGAQFERDKKAYEESLESPDE